MKTLYIIGGTMGVGKTSVCQQMKLMLDSCAFLDGDWCWDMHPFLVTDETKAMVMDNICHHLNAFLHCSAYENVVFCWVMHQQQIIDEILTRIDTKGWNVVCVSLTCAPRELEDRLRRDVDAGVRTEDVIARSLARIGMYDKLDTVKVDTSHKNQEQIAGEIIQLGHGG